MVHAEQRPSQQRLRLGLATVALSVVWSVGAAPALGEVPGLRFQHLSVDDGLSHPTVWSILQDQQGFLWLGTDDGLNRYDGHGFDVFRHDPKVERSLADDTVLVLFEDRAGTLWIGTYGGGLDRHRKSDDSFEHHRHDPRDPASLSDDIVLALWEDAEGALWVGTQRGLDRLDHKQRSFESHTHLLGTREDAEGHSVSALHGDDRGNLWIGTFSGLHRYTPATGETTHFRQRPEGASGALRNGALQNDSIYGFATDPEGSLWIATIGGLSRFDPSTETFEHFRHDPRDPTSLIDDEVLSLQVDQRGDLWVGTVRGLSRRLGPGLGFSNQPRQVGNAEGLTNDSILTLFEDRTGILWMGTHGGAEKLVPGWQAIEVLRHQPGFVRSLGGSLVKAVLEDSQGRLWVGSEDGGLDRIDPGDGPTVQYPSTPGSPGDLPHPTVVDIVEDGDTLWVATYDGLAMLGADAGDFRVHRHVPDDPASLRSSSLASLFVDRQGDLWVGTGIGLDRRQVGGVGFLHYPRFAGEPEGLGRDPITAIFEDRSSTLWVGSFAGGVYRRRPGQRFEAMGGLLEKPADFPPFSRLEVATFHESSVGELWIGTYGRGLVRLDRTRKRVSVFLPQTGGLASSTVRAIVEDAQGRLWLGTHGGLSRFDPATGRAHNFDAADGLQGAIFTAAARGRDGRLIFGGTHGVDIFSPEDLSPDPHAPPVALTGQWVLNEPLRPGTATRSGGFPRSALGNDRVILTHRDSLFSVEFAALHFAKPAKQRYAYRLEGLQGRWVTVDAEHRRAQYANLEPGRYRFRVKASNGDGVWNDAGASLDIHVLAPPWKTWWAYTAYAFLGSALLIAVVRMEQRRFEQEREVNRRLQDADRLKSRLLQEQDAMLAERGEQLATRERLIDELEVRNNELLRFHRAVSHDLKNPLLTISSYVGRIRKDMETGRSERLDSDLQRIDRATQTLQVLVEGLDELTNLRMGSTADGTGSNLGLLAFPHLIDRALEPFHPKAPPGTFEVSVDAPLPRIFGDVERVRRLIQCLVENALKFASPDRPPEVRLHVSAAPEGSEVEGIRLTVADNGVGIQAEYLEKVFGLFEQLDNRTPGVGLGLTLAQRIADHHGGSIRLESPGLDRGTTAIVILPAIAPRSPQARDLRTSGAKADAMGHGKGDHTDGHEPEL